jgi:copper homeostasis protein
VKPVLIEVCVDTLEGALAAQEGGAGRIELCADLVVGGTTPSAGAIALARQALTIALHVMIRPRAGDFCYSRHDLAVMLHDIDVAKSLGADGVVLGVLRPDGQVDLAATSELIAAARPMSVTFHRAFDLTPDPLSSLDDLIGLGADRVLTSGQKPAAFEGAATLARLVAHAKNAIAVMAGGGIDEHNIARLVGLTGVSEVHMSAREQVESLMRFRRQDVNLGSAAGLSDSTRAVTSAQRIRACRKALTQANHSV